MLGKRTRRTTALRIACTLGIGLTLFAHTLTMAADTAPQATDPSDRGGERAKARPKTVAYPRQTGPNESDVDRLVRSQEARVNKARKGLTDAMKRCEKQIRNLPIDQDAKALLLQPLAQDRIGFESSDRLPKSAELLDDVAKFVGTYADIKANVQMRRAAEEKKASDKTNGQGVNSGLTGLKNLEARLAKVVDGGDALKPGSRWTGSRQFPNATMTVELVVTQRQGTRFLGELYQSMGGGSTGMRIEGQILGNEVTMKTTSMIHGTNRDMFVSGVVVKDQIIAAAGEVAGGKPAPGSWFSLQPRKGR
jgi:hypothetical protein